MQDNKRRRPGYEPWVPGRKKQKPADDPPQEAEPAAEEAEPAAAEESVPAADEKDKPAADEKDKGVAALPQEPLKLMHSSQLHLSQKDRSVPLIRWILESPPLELYVCRFSGKQMYFTTDIWKPLIIQGLDLCYGTRDQQVVLSAATFEMSNLLVFDRRVLKFRAFYGKRGVRGAEKGEGGHEDFIALANLIKKHIFGNSPHTPKEVDDFVNLLKIPDEVFPRWSRPKISCHFAVMLQIRRRYFFCILSGLEKEITDTKFVKKIELLIQDLDPTGSWRAVASEAVVNPITQVYQHGLNFGSYHMADKLAFGDFSRNAMLHITEKSSWRREQNLKIEDVPKLFATHFPCILELQNELVKRNLIKPWMWDIYVPRSPF